MQAGAEDRIDKLEKKVDDGFVEMRAEFKAVRKEMRENFREVRGEIGALNRTVMQMFAGMWLTMILGFAAIFLQHL
jgi:uncharacterized coiled-coil DUF342 family protein